MRKTYVFIYLFLFLGPIFLAAVLTRSAHMKDLGIFDLKNRFYAKKLPLWAVGHLPEHLEPSI